ncbi:MAG TPA: hypothetical protein VD926_15330, partial [Acidimicrobiales bacterium]|nr:hypothetical protein [Acidimicrobiales bacterium]
FLTHLATGRLILDSGAIPTTDPYSFTAHGEPWTVQSWLASVAYAGAEDLAGLVGIRLLVAITTAGLCYLLWRLSEPAGAVVTRVGLILPVLAIGFDGWTERPMLFGLLGLAAVHVLANGTGRAWLAAPIFALWVNTHGSFPLGGALLGLLLVGRLLDRQPVRREAQVLGWAVVGVLLGGINPLGPRLIFFPIEMLGKMEALGNVKEWQPPSYDELGPQVFAALLLVALPLLLLRHRSWRSILPALVFVGLALTTARNVAPASIVLFAALAPALRGIGDDHGREPRPILRPAAAVVILMAGLAATGSLLGPDTDLVGYPEEAVAWMEDNDLLGPDSRVAARDFAGNYLEAHSGTDVPVFVDDRYDMYPLEVIEDYAVLNHGEEGWEEVLERWDASAVLWDEDTDLWPLLRESDRWDVVYEDDTWLVAVPG